MAEQQKFTVKVSKKYEDAERIAIGLDVIDHIIKRSKAGKDKNNKNFPGYSEGYTESLDFSIAGKSKRVNLTLSGEMLNSLEILESNEGEIVIGIPEDDSLNNAKAEGNIKGTYGQSSPIRGKKRDFMGISRKDLTDIKKDYPINNKANRENTRSRALELVLAADLAGTLVEDLDLG